MAEVPSRVLRTVGRLGAMDPGVRPAGLMFEDPSGGVFPFELGPQVARVRQVSCGAWHGRMCLTVAMQRGLGWCTCSARGKGGGACGAGHCPPRRLA